MSWSVPPPNWKTPAGQLLDQFFAAVAQALPNYDRPLTVFGSAPIQLCLDEAFTSDDADIMVATDVAQMREIGRSSGLIQTGVVHRRAFPLEIVPRKVFRSTLHYLERAHIETRHGLRIVVPHVRDVLIGKLHRSRCEGQDGLVIKDMKAFRRVRELCHGHPSEADLLEDLMDCEPWFRQSSDESSHYFHQNLHDLWLALFNRKLDVQNEVLAPVQKERQEAFFEPHIDVQGMLRSLEK